MPESNDSEPRSPVIAYLKLAALLLVLISIFIVAFGEGTFKGWRLHHDIERMGPVSGSIVRGFDLLYGPVKHSILAQIVGFALSLAAVALTFLIAQVLYGSLHWKRKIGERVAILGSLIWVLVAFNWISKMPVAFLAAFGILIFVALNNSNRWLPVLIDPEKNSSRSVILVFLSLMILNAFFWWPGFQLFCALGIAGTAIGDNAAALVGSRSKIRFRFSRDGKTVKGTAAMFISTLAFNVLIAHLMIHIPGIQKELFRFLIITLAASLSAAAELFSPRGFDNLLIGPITAFPIYFYIH